MFLITAVHTTKIKPDYDNSMSTENVYISLFLLTLFSPMATPLLPRKDIDWSNLHFAGTLFNLPLSQQNRK